jgi:hypothetical protein
VGAAKLVWPLKTRWASSSLGFRAPREIEKPKNRATCDLEAWMPMMWSNEELSGQTMLVECTVKGKVGYVVR